MEAQEGFQYHFRSSWTGVRPCRGRERRNHGKPQGRQSSRPFRGRTMSRSEQLRLLRRWAPHAGAGILLAALFSWDRPIYEAIRGFRNPFLDEMTNRVSHLRGAAFPILVGLSLVGLGACRKRTRIWRAGTALLLTAALCGAVVSVLK